MYQNVVTVTRTTTHYHTPAGIDVLTIFPSLSILPALILMSHKKTRSRSSTYIPMKLMRFRWAMSYHTRRVHYSAHDTTAE